MRILPAVAALAALIPACAEPRTPPALAASLPPDVASGLGIYTARCEGCHGPDGGGTRAGPALLPGGPGPAWEARLRQSVREGVPPTAGSAWTVRGMPPVPMAPADEARLGAYLRWLAAGALTDSP